MEFSNDDSMLLAVSRDRQFSVFKIHRTGTCCLLTICEGFLLFENPNLQQDSLESNNISSFQAEIKLHTPKIFCIVIVGLVYWNPFSFSIFILFIERNS